MGLALIKDDVISDSATLKTISFNLPVEHIDLVRELADLRLMSHRRDQRIAERDGRKGPEARRSASKIVVEALSAHRSAIEDEIRLLAGRLATRE